MLLPGLPTSIGPGLQRAARSASVELVLDFGLVHVPGGALVLNFEDVQ